MTEALIGLAAGVAVWFVTRTVLRWLFVRGLKRKVSGVPGGAEALAAALAQRTSMPQLPKDPTALTTFVRVPPSGGAPGEEFWAPARSSWPVRTEPGGSRADATIRLTANGAAILVVCLGSVAEQGSAPTRPDAAGSLQNGMRRLGPVAHVQTGAGHAYRHTIDFGRSRVTDWHLDHDGWAFVVGFLREPAEEHLGVVMEHVFASWRWLPAEDVAQVML